MAWDHLSITKAHLVYIILGGFTSLFMLCSSFIKERLYIGEATVATICGVIFGPHAANLIDPLTWGNTDNITLEFSRIVLVVQCFAVGVELPKYYMEKHWRSVVFLLLPVMTYGWLVTSLFIWWMIPRLSWLESLTVAACVTATDPVLASSVVGKGNFAKRIPKHLRDVLSAESGCNDGMAFPFIYMALYLIEDRLSAKEVTYHWFCLTILYECVFGCVYGFLIGYIGRHGIKYAERRDLVDRESFLVFYFVLALFCAGSGSILGVDDLLVGFSAGVGFSNDGWFTQKTEESHVSNVIDLLLNLAYFVYLGTIIPWQQYNEPSIGTTPWRLVVISLFVIFFRRIPIMLALKPFIPDIKTWREALFAGHFGPIGVGAIFVAILARAELETSHTTPLASYPAVGAPNATLVALIWPIVTFLVITSIIVHGSSIAVFTLGKRINTLTLTMSYTVAGEEGPGWMNRLPRISSTSRSQAKTQDSDIIGEKVEYPPGTLPPVGYPGNFLRRQKEEDDPSRSGSRTSSLRPLRRKKQWSDGIGPGGPVTQSAIFPQRRSDSTPLSQRTEDTLTPGDTTPEDKEKEKSSPSNSSTKGEGKLGEVQHDPQMEEIMHHKRREKRDTHQSDAERHPDEVKVYDEGDDIIIENEDGDVLTTQQTPSGNAHHKTAKKLEAELKKDIEHPSQGFANVKKMVGTWRHKVEAGKGEKGKGKEVVHKRGPALAYQFGNTIIVEDEDGEVVKKYELPSARDSPKTGDGTPRQGLTHMSSWAGRAPRKLDANTDANAPSSSAAAPPPHSTLSRVRTGLQRRGTGLGFSMGKVSEDPPKSSGHGSDEDDRHIRFTIGHHGKRLTKEDFIKEIQSLDPKARCEVVQQSDAPAVMKEMAKKDANGHDNRNDRLLKHNRSPVRHRTAKEVTTAMAKRRGEHVVDTDSETASDTEGGLSQSPSTQVPESPAERRRREEVMKTVAANSSASDSDSESRGRDRKPSQPVKKDVRDEEEETQAEKRRREAALGLGGKAKNDREVDSDDDDTPRIPPPSTPARESGRERQWERPALQSMQSAQSSQSVQAQPRGIRFAEEPLRGK